MHEPYRGRCAEVREIMPYFYFDHLPRNLQTFSRHYYILADNMVSRLPDSAELIAGLRKLLEAKDCFVRAAVTLNQQKGNKNV